MKKIISLLLVISLVLPLAIPVSAALAPDELDLSQYTLEDIMAMSNEEYEALLGEFERVYDPFGTYETDPIIEPDNPKLRWTSGEADETNGYTEEGSHESITAAACEILMNDKGFFEEDAVNAIATVLVLSLASLLPDQDEIGLIIFNGHFYHAEKKTNYMGSKNNTALTNTISHYDKAVAAAKSGDMTTAYEEIGRALHYLQDAGEPHHAANITAAQYYNVHGAFEEYADSNITKYVDELFGTAYSHLFFNTSNSYDYDTAASNGVIYLVDGAASMAYTYVEYVKNKYDTSIWDFVAGETVCNSVVLSAFLMYKFTCDAKLKMYRY